MRQWKSGGLSASPKHTRRGRASVFAATLATLLLGGVAPSAAFAAGPLDVLRFLSPPSPSPQPSSSPAPLFSDAFSGPDGVITNHYAYWTGDSRAHRSSDWEAESGCFLRRGNTGWTGIPTGGVPNRDCTDRTGSNVFRVFTKRSDFRDVAVTMDLRNNGFTAGTPTRPAVSWDGVKLFLRRQDGTYLYSAEVNRRQGNLMIQKKCPGGSVSGGTYHVLGQTRTGSHPSDVGSWERVGGTVRTNADGSVTLQVIRAGSVTLESTDRGAGCPPIRAPGQVGIRGDNTNFNVDNFTVSQR